LDVLFEVELYFCQENLKGNHRLVWFQICKCNVINGLTVLFYEIVHVFVELRSLALLAYCLVIFTVFPFRLLFKQTFAFFLLSRWLDVVGLLVFCKATQVLGKLRFSDLLVKPEKNLMQQLDLLLYGLVVPQTLQVKALNKHESPDFAIGFLFEQIVL